MTGRMLGEAELAVLGAKPLAPEDPTQIGRYHLCGVLGIGGMGRVYLGWADGRYAAVKVIRPEFADGPEFRTRFDRELKSISRVDAAFTAPLLDAQADATRPWMATEYVAGIPLSEASSPADPLPTATVWRLAADVGMALSSLHQAGLIHRDLKPANVILALDGPKVIDFGVARSADMSQLTVAGQHVGTPSYMAPEQAEAGVVSPASDVFALGGLLAFAATGRAPFGGGSSTEVMYRVVHGKPDLTRIAELDPQLHALVAQCMAKDPAARPTTAGVVAAVAAAQVTGDWPDHLYGRIARRAQVAGQTMPTMPDATIGPLGGPFTTDADLTGLPVRPAEQAAKRRRWPIFAGAAAGVALACAAGLVFTLLPADKPTTNLSAENTRSTARTTSAPVAKPSVTSTAHPSNSSKPTATSLPDRTGPRATSGGPISAPSTSAPTSTQAAPPKPTWSAYGTFKAVSYSAQSGGMTPETCTDTGGGQDLGSIGGGGWLEYKSVDFGTAPANRFFARVSSAIQKVNARVDIRLDSRTSAPIGSFAVTNTGGWQSWTTVSVSTKPVTGIHNVYLTVTSDQWGYVLNINWFTFTH